MKTAIILVVMILVISTAAFAERGHTTLLATTDPFGRGVTADLVLETREGTGQVFIDSRPPSKVDTQISTRFAKETACAYLGRKCNDIDFFYNIRANAAIIGGPSAGAAMTVLTVAVLENQELNDSIAITGTINAGNVIGPVGGVSEKIEAAAERGIKKILIPKGEAANFARNASIDPAEYGKELGVEVIEVFSIDEALLEFTGKTFRQETADIEVDQSYAKVMAELTEQLCERTSEIAVKVEEIYNGRELNESLQAAMQFAQNLSLQGKEAAQRKNNYAAASFCFGANVRYKFLELYSQNLTGRDMLERLELIRMNTELVKSQIENATTIVDAQVSAVVKNRLSETLTHINASQNALEKENTEGSVYELAFANERLQSAVAWSRFFGAMDEEKISLDMLRNACDTKLAESQERIEYANILIGSGISGAIADLEDALKFRQKNDYAQCLHSATIAKSEANTLLSVFGVRDAEIEGIVERKIDAAAASIARQTQKNIFPIIGYSYYEYAQTLLPTDKYSALLYSDYALEFSNMDIYFDDATEPSRPINVKQRMPVIAWFFAGMAAGILLSITVASARKRRKKRILVNRAKARKR